jgi:hypothetical protein
VAKKVQVNSAPDDDASILESVSLTAAQMVEEESISSEEYEEKKPTDPDWTDYVLSLLHPDELSPEGRPTCDGLRRVSETCLGDILRSEVNVVQGPCQSNDHTAVVEFTLEYLCRRTGMAVSFTASADVNDKNCDPRFAVFATATAETRAEGRALRKALRLRRVLTAEEPSSLFSDSDLSNNGKSTPMQHSFIRTICERNDVNINAYLGASKSFKWDGHLENIPHKSAVVIIAHLNEWQRDRTKIDPKYKGYDSNWQKQNSGD